MWVYARAWCHDNGQWNKEQETDGTNDGWWNKEQKKNGTKNTRDNEIGDGLRNSQTIKWKTLEQWIKKHSNDETMEFSCWILLFHQTKFQKSIV